ncbi:unnamed protein product [Rhizophagus irregularis]|uniref:Uncharacterized protein n=1 Tax=Rhizophagus irregularis TaxID=588596 RepID=A0A915ZU02_9GLOM|nr:unnamed protein product [Rhizophagus irregularis]
MIQIVLIKCIIYIFNRLLYDCVNSSIEVVNCQPACAKYNNSLVLSERCQGPKNGNNHPKVFFVFLRTTTIFGVGDYVWVPWSTIVNSISIKVKNELSRKIRGNRLVFQHVGELF